MDILETLAASTRKRVDEEKKNTSLEVIAEKAEAAAASELSKKGSFEFPFERALKSPGLSLICEVKKASPSKGIISEDFPYMNIAKAYESGGADAMSILTEPEYFMGTVGILKEIRAEVKTPILRKDFTIDEYMILQAKAAGADAVLLICSILNDDELKCFFKLADSIGLSAVFEAHDEAEIGRSVRAGARIIGVNNRNLRDFSIDMGNSLSLMRLVPEGTVFISESGVKNADDLVSLQRSKADAALVGEALMRADDPAATLKEWKEQLKADCEENSLK